MCEGRGLTVVQQRHVCCPAGAGGLAGRAALHYYRRSRENYPPTRYSLHIGYLYVHSYTNKLAARKTNKGGSQAGGPGNCRWTVAEVRLFFLSSTLSVTLLRPLYMEAKQFLPLGTHATLLEKASSGCSKSKRKAALSAVVAPRSRIQKSDTASATTYLKESIQASHSVHVLLRPMKSGFHHQRIRSCVLSQNQHRTRGSARLARSQLVLGPVRAAGSTSIRRETARPQKN